MGSPSELVLSAPWSGSTGGAAALDPDSFTVQCNLALWLLAQRRMEEAVEHARHVARIDPKQQLPHCLLGRALATLGEFCEAAECFRRALALAPDDDKLREFEARASRECETAGGVP